MLSSDTEHMTHESFGFHAKSDIFAVCPPWMNNNSGGPSSASSLVCSSPIRLKSQMFSLRSVPLDAKMVSLCGDHCTWNISSLCEVNVCNFTLILRKSHRATVLSAEPVAKMYSENGLKDKQFTSAKWASTTWAGLFVSLDLVSQIIRVWSSETEPNNDSCNKCQATSSTTEVCPVNVDNASMVFSELTRSLISHKQMVWSSEALSKCPLKFAFHDKP